MNNQQLQELTDRMSERMSGEKQTAIWKVETWCKSKISDIEMCRSQYSKAELKKLYDGFYARRDKIIAKINAR